MKRDDPKRLELRADRERAQLWLDILCKGIGKEFIDGYRNCAEDLRAVIDRVNGELLDALIASEKAEAAYRPYCSRRRIRVHPPRAHKAKSLTKSKPKTKKAAS